MWHKWFDHWKRKVEDLHGRVNGLEMQVKKLACKHVGSIQVRPAPKLGEIIAYCAWCEQYIDSKIVKELICPKSSQTPTS